jgi:hypothetical protein
MLHLYIDTARCQIGLLSSKGASRNFGADSSTLWHGDPQSPHFQNMCAWACTLAPAHIEQVTNGAIDVLAAASRVTVR